MSIYKRMGSFMLSLLLVFSLLGPTFTIQTFAAANPALSAESKTVKAGEQFTVAVSLANATSVYGGNFTLQYDSSLLSIDANSYEFGSIVSGHTKNCNTNYQSAGNLIRVTFSGASAVTASGTLITFTFTAKENMSGTAALQFNAYKMYDENGSAITSTATGSTITIAEDPVASPALSVTSKTVTVGETVSVPVVISNSGDVYGGNFTLQYDSDLLSIGSNSYEFGSIVSGHTKNCNTNYQSAGNLIRVTFSGADAVSSDGTLITFTFTAKASGTATLKFNAYKMYDENGTSISTVVSNGTVEVVPQPTPPTRELVSVEISSNPTKTTYEIGESLDTNGLKLKLTYSDNSTETIASGFNVSGFSSTTAGIKTITVTYQSFTNTFTVTINDPSVTIVAQGECDYSLIWTLYSDGKLTIKKSNPNNSGNMYDYAYRDYPWSQYRSKIKTIEILDGVTSIGKLAFENCDNLTTVVFPSTMVDIGAQSFNSCNSLKSVTISGNNAVIGDFAFNNCTALESLVLSEGIIEIGSQAFYNCSSLTTLIIPKSVTEISGNAFTGCSGLETIIVEDGNSVYHSDGNCLIYTSAGWMELGCKNSVIPNDGSIVSVTGFENCTGLTSIAIPEGVKEIGSFSGCTNLTSITIPRSVTTIGQYAFSGCDNLTIYGYPNTNASAYAHNNDIPFVVLVNGIEIVNTPTKTTYYINDSLNTSGLKIQVNCADGTTENITSGFTTSGFSSTSAGTKTVTVSYEGFTDTFTVTVSTPSITLSSNSKSMVVGDMIEITATTTPSDQTVVWSSSNTDVAIVLDGTVMAKKSGSATITAQFTYNGITYSKTCNLTVEDKPAPVPSSIAISSNPTKSTYYIGDSLNTSGLQLHVIYSDGTTETIASGFTTSGFSSTSAGTKTVTVSYEGFTDTFTVTVKTPSITLSASSKSMTVGDSTALTATTTPSGQAVIWTSSDTNVATVSGGTITAKASGSTTITAKFTYNGKTYSKTCSVTVDKPTPVPTSIAISSNPAKTTYYIGDSLSTSGLKLLVTYSDGTTETITSGFTTSGFSSTSAGAKTITVSYEEFTDTFTVTVKTPSIALSASSKSMTVGDSTTLTATTTPSGQTVTWTSSNTSVATVSGGTITVKASGSATITAKFTYNGKTYSKTCSVTVADVPAPTPAALSVISKPAKTTYEIGESLNTSGLKLKLTYSDGSTETITSGFTTSGFSSATAGTKTVTVKYSGLTATFTVIVNAPVPVYTGKLIVSSTETMAGKEVALTLTIKDNPGVAGLAVSFKYDETVLTLKDSENGGLFNGFTAGKNFAWDESENVTDDGVLASFIFTVAEDAPAGDYNVEVIVRSCTNEDLDDVELSTTAGVVSVSDFMYGDSNGDNKIDMKDVVLLRKYITNFDYDTNTSSVNVELGADANGDNKIDMKDVVILRKYITNYDYDTESSTVVLGPQ